MTAFLLEGPVVQRVRASSTALVVQVRAAGATRYLVLASGKSVGVSALKPKLVASPGQEHWKKPLEGARVARVREACVVFTRGEDWVIARIEGRDGRATVGFADAAAVLALEGEPALERDEAAWLARGAELAISLESDSLDEERRSVERVVTKAIAKLARRIAAVEGDLALIHEARATAAQASAFVAAAARAPRGARSLSVTDWSSGDATELTLALDPSRSAREQLDAKFARSKRMKEGAVIARARLAAATAMKNDLEAIAGEVRAAADRATLARLLAGARAVAPRDVARNAVSADRPKVREAARESFRLFRSVRGERVLVGRGSEDNDRLTFRIAKPHDLWLHAKNIIGAHVIVPLDKKASCPSDVLIDAAHLAAHFSDARGEAVVEVQTAPRGYVRKPRGAPPGLVVVEREKVVVLRVDPAVVARLLATEEA